MKQKEKEIQNKTLLCYEILITNYDNCEKKNRNDILNSFLYNIKYHLESDIFIDKYSLLICLNKIICIVQDKYEFVDIIPYILNYLLVNDNNIKLIALKIINNIIKNNKEKSKELKEEIIKYIKKIKSEEYIEFNIKIIIDEIINSLDNKYEIVDINKKKVENKNKYDNNSGNIKKKNEINNKKSNNYKNKLKINLKNIESIYKQDKLNYKLKNKNNKDNIKIEIFVKSSPNSTNKKIANRKIIDLNSNSLLEKRKENYSTTILGNNSENRIKKKKKIFSTFINEDDYLNPIKIWSKFDERNLNPIKIWSKFDERNLTQVNNRNKNINKFNIKNKKEDLDLELLTNEIEKFSKFQNLLSEKIFLLESNTFKRVSYFNSRIEELEKKLLNDSNKENEKEENIKEKNIRDKNIRDKKIREEKKRGENIKEKNIGEKNIREEKIRDENIGEKNKREEKIRDENIREKNLREEIIRGENMKNYQEKQFIDYPYKIIYPSNSLSEKLIIFLNEKDNTKSIRYLPKITEEQIKEIDNNLIEDIVNRLISFLEKGIYIHESINFIKKIFIKNKIRFKLNTIKRLLFVLDILLKRNRILTEADSFDVSLIISSVKYKI